MPASFKGTAEEKFNSILKIINNDCIEWGAGITAGGYGVFTHKYRKYSAHRFVYELHYGNIPKEMYICHKCDNRKCVKLDHLFLGTPTENAHDMIKKGRHNWDKMREVAKKRKKISDFMLIDIKNRLINGESRRVIAKSLSVAKGTIDHIFYHKMTSKQRKLCSKLWVMGKNQYTRDYHG